MKGDEVELLGPITLDKQMQYVGRRTISKYGCSGCHDIPGFENAKPIGTGLADWGRKSPDRLAFEQIVEYIKHGHGAPPRWEPETGGNVTGEELEMGDVGRYGHTYENFKDFDPNTGYYLEKLFGHQRQGFIWQKLREPRSYDFQKTQNKGYNERLRMPKFTVLNDDQREAIITFVLGLVAEPPPPQYVYKSKPERDAIVQGWQVIEKFNCTGCHATSLDRLELEYGSDTFTDAPEIADYDFLQAHFTPEQEKASLATDAAGLMHASVMGTPAVDDAGQPLRLDEDGAPIEADDTETPGFLSFTPWENVLINGQARQAGYNLLVPEATIQKRYPQVGGFLAKLAFPVVVEAERVTNPNVKADEAWGWLPPPLVHEGSKVQSEWLYEFLLDPHMIRPATVLRMPKFNMSPAERASWSITSRQSRGPSIPTISTRAHASRTWPKPKASHPHRLDDAMKIVVDGNYCVKCHLVGDFMPTGSERAKAPQMDRVFRRLRPEFVLDWVANPKRLLPYTPMPVNIPHDKGVSEELYKGTPIEQLNAVVDLLMNFDRFTQSKTPIAPMVKPAPPAAAANEPAAAPDKAAVAAPPAGTAVADESL